jgi:hypothetical protein
MASDNTSSFGESGSDEAQSLSGMNPSSEDP